MQVVQQTRRWLLQVVFLPSHLHLERLLVRMLGRLELPRRTLALVPDRVLSF
jgi:hypothetical protein